MCACVCETKQRVYRHQCAYVESAFGLDSLLSRRSWPSKSSRHAWQQTPFPAELSRGPASFVKMGPVTGRSLETTWPEDQAGLPVRAPVSASPGLGLQTHTFPTWSLGAKSGPHVCLQGKHLTLSPATSFFSSSGCWTAWQRLRMNYLCSCRHQCKWSRTQGGGVWHSQ